MMPFEPEIEITRNTDFMNTVQAFLLRTPESLYFVLTSSNEYSSKYRTIKELVNALKRGETYADYFSERILKGSKINPNNPDITSIIEWQSKSLHELVFRSSVSTFIENLQSEFPEEFL